MSDLFESEALLAAYDAVLPLSDHYRSVLSLHLRALSECDEVVDLGCGTGSASMEWLRAGKRVVAVDSSPGSLERLRAKALEAGLQGRLTLHRGDISGLTGIEDESSDGASSMIAAHLLEKYVEHIQEAYRIIRQGGRFVITGRTPGKDPEVLAAITQESLERQGRLRELEGEFRLIAEALLGTANERSPSLKTEAEALDALESAGFKNVRLLANLTQGLMYTATGEK